MLGPSSGRPLIFNRGAGDQNPFGPTELSGYDGAVFEVKNFYWSLLIFVLIFINYNYFYLYLKAMKNGCVATITLFNW